MTDFGILLQKAGYSVPEAAKYLDYSEGHIYRWIRGEEKPRDSVTRLLELHAAWDSNRIFCNSRNSHNILLFALGT